MAEKLTFWWQRNCVNCELFTSQLIPDLLNKVSSRADADLVYCVAVSLICEQQDMWSFLLSRLHNVTCVVSRQTWQSWGMRPSEPSSSVPKRAHGKWPDVKEEWRRLSNVFSKRSVNTPQKAQFAATAQVATSRAVFNINCERLNQKPGGELFQKSN